MTHLTALEQQREDQALGAAFRRAVAAAPKDSMVELTKRFNSPDFSHPFLASVEWFDSEYRNRYVTAESPTAALEALADALEARRAAE